jgi:hypothetical protein
MKPMHRSIPAASKDATSSCIGATTAELVLDAVVVVDVDDVAVVVGALYCEMSRCM